MPHALLLTGLPFFSKSMLRPFWQDQLGPRWLWEEISIVLPLQTTWWS